LDDRSRNSSISSRCNCPRLRTRECRSCTSPPASLAPRLAVWPRVGCRHGGTQTKPSLRLPGWD
jgi:hypothetical protein